jgi:3-hydroxybutyrate dehydrogenase
MWFERRTALITGGGRGIGRSIALALSQAGLKQLVIVGRTQSELEHVAQEVGGHALVVDLARSADVERMVGDVRTRFERIDILINCAGVAESAPLHRTSDEMFELMMAVNVRAPFLLSRAFVPGMVKAGWGRVVNIASNAGLTGYAYTSAYCASKHALVGLTRSIAQEIAPSNVSVNAICPGFVETGMTETTIDRIVKKTGRSTAEAREELAAMNPQRRLIQASEIAHLVVSLMPDEARGIHGQAIALDGGQVMK